MSIFKKLLGNKAEDADEKSGTVTKSGEKPTARPSGAWRFDVSAENPDPKDPVDKIRRDRARKASMVFDERRELRVLHKDTKTLSIVKVRLKEILALDPKFSSFRQEVKDELIDLFAMLIPSAEKGLTDVFYERLDKKRAQLAKNEHLNRFFWTNFSTWLMGEQFRFNPADRLLDDHLPKTGAHSPLWTVLSSTHEELSERRRPQLLASQGDNGKNTQVTLMEFVQGSVKLDQKRWY